jgi:hypothetical protein
MHVFLYERWLLLILKFQNNFFEMKHDKNKFTFFF